MSVRRVLVVASSPVIRAGLESLLAGASDYSVLGAARLPGPTGSETARAPDVVVLALDTERDAKPAIELAADQGASVPFVVIGEDPVAEWGARALRLGARAVLSHAAGPTELVAAIEAVAAGLVVLPPELVGSAAIPARPSEPGPQHLTGREIEILACSQRGSPTRRLPAGLAFRSIR